MISGICLLISVLLILYSNFRLSAIVRKQQMLLGEIHVNNTRDILRLFMLLDIMEVQCSNPLIFSIYQKLRTTDFDKLPKDEKGQINFAREIVKEFHEKIWAHLKERVDHAQEPEEKKFFQHKLEKLTDVINLLSSVDENSSMEYMKLVAVEVQKTMSDAAEDPNI